MCSLFHFKIEINGILSPPFWIFLFGIHFQFNNSLPTDLIKVAIWWRNQVFYFLLQSEAGFYTLYIGFVIQTYCDMGEYFIYILRHEWKLRCEAWIDQVNFKWKSRGYGCA